MLVRLETELWPWPRSLAGISPCQPPLLYHSGPSLVHLPPPLPVPPLLFCDFSTIISKTKWGPSADECCWEPWSLGDLDGIISSLITRGLQKPHGKELESHRAISCSFCWVPATQPVPLWHSFIHSFTHSLTYSHIYSDLPCKRYYAKFGESSDHKTDNKTQFHNSGINAALGEHTRGTPNQIFKGTRKAPQEK